MTRVLRISLFLLLASAARPTRAEPTLELYIRDVEEVLMGDPVSTAIDAEGRLSLGLGQDQLIEGPGRPGVVLGWARGGLLLGTAGAGLLRVRPAAKAEVLEGAKGLVLSALAPIGEDGRGGAWFATSPSGTLHRWNGREIADVLKPRAKYVWDLLPDGDGVYAVTGAPAQLLRIEKGKPTTVFEAEETHLRVLARHPSRGLILGGGEKGIVYAVDAKGRARALYDSALDEVTALEVSPDGAIYAAVVSGKTDGALDPGKWIGPVGDDAKDDASPFKGSEVVRIAPSGEVERLWTSNAEGALALSLDPKARRLHIATGTGPKGRARIYALELSDRDRLVLAARLPPPMATDMIRRPDGGLLIATAPDGAVYEVGPKPRLEGEYLSVEQDLRRVARIGRLWMDADVPSGASASVSIRTGNTKEPDGTWSDWSDDVPAGRGGAIEVPDGRYAQLRAVLRASRSGRSPVVRSMHASVRRQNLPPEVKEVFALRPGIYLKPMPDENDDEKVVTINDNVLDELRRPQTERDRNRARAGEAPGQLTAAWKAQDPNGDQLLYSAELVAEDGPVRAELGSGLDVPFVTFDSRSFPDGRYRVVVSASDRPSNAPAEVLEDAKRSDVFTIDNAPPRISKLTARRRGKGLEVHAEIEDAASRLAQTELSLDGGPWVYFPAEDGFLDGFSETLGLTIEDPTALGGRAEGPHTIQVRVEDTASNRATAGTLVK